MHHRFRFTAQRFTAAADLSALITFLREGLTHAVPEADIEDQSGDGRSFWLNFSGDRYWIYAGHTLGSEFVVGIEGREATFAWTQNTRNLNRADSIVAALRSVVLSDSGNSLQSEEDD